MKKFIGVAAAAALLACAGAADAHTIYACSRGVYTITTVEMVPTADGWKDVVHTTIVPGPCSGEWSYVEALAINPNIGSVTFEEGAAGGLGPMKPLTGESPVVRAVRNGWKILGSGRVKTTDRILTKKQANQALARSAAMPVLRIKIPLKAVE